MGFFFDGTNSKVKKAPRRREASAKFLASQGCTLCPLQPDCDKASTLPVGTGSVYLLAEPLTAVACRKRQPLAVDGGRSLVDRYMPMQVNYREASLTRSYMQKDDASLPAVIQCCASKVIADIEKHRPAVVVGLGYAVLSQFIPGYSNLDALRGIAFPYTFGTHTCWFMPTYSQSFLYSMRTEDRRGKMRPSPHEKAFAHDLQEACALAAGGSAPILYAEDPYTGVETVLGAPGDVEVVREYLKRFTGASHIGLDIEATNLKPQTMIADNKEEFIISIALSDAESTISFPLDHPKASPEYRDGIWEVLYSFITSGPIMIAHNLAYELKMLSHFLGTEVITEGSWTDTMLYSYVMNPRKGIHSLDLNCRRHLGVGLKSITGVNAKDCLAYPLRELLEYNALDAKFTTLLYEELLETVPATQLPMVENRRALVLALAHCEKVGLQMNRVWVEDQIKSYREKVQQHLALVHGKVSVKKAQRQLHHPLNPGSDKDLQALFNGVLGYQLEGFDAAALAGVDHEVVPLVIEYRELTKTLGLFEGWYSYLTEDGRIYPNFNAAFTSSARLSSQNPNCQNAPKNKGKWKRNMIIAPEGHVMASLDYGQLEARVMFALSHDHTLENILWDDYDIHTHYAERFAKLYPACVGGEAGRSDPVRMKEMRTLTKGFVFGGLFGGSVPTLAATINIPINIVQQVSGEFWEQCAITQEWHEQLYSFYEKHFFIRNLMDHRRYGPLTSEIINFPIQSTAAVLCAEALIQVTKEVRPPVCTIHDSFEFYLPEATWESEIESIAEIICTTACNNSFGLQLDNVPWTCDAEVGSHWGELKDYKSWSSNVDFGQGRGEGSHINLRRV